MLIFASNWLDLRLQFQKPSLKLMASEKTSVAANEMVTLREASLMEAVKTSFISGIPH